MCSFPSVFSKRFIYLRVCGSDGKASVCNAGHPGSIPGGDASPGGDDPLEKEMAIHSSILVWRIPWTQEPGRLQSMGSQSRRHLSDFTFFSLLFFSKHPSTAKSLERHALPFRHKKWGLIQAQAHLWRHEWGPHSGACALVEPRARSSRACAPPSQT